MPPPDDDPRFRLTLPSGLTMPPYEAVAQRWLRDNTDQLRLLSLDELHWRLWREVPGSELLSDSTAHLMFLQWALEQKQPLRLFPLPNPGGLGPSSPTGGLPTTPGGINLNLPLAYKYGLTPPVPPPNPAFVPAPTPPPAPTKGNSAFVEFFKGLVPSSTEVKLVKSAGGEVTLSFSGLTADLKKSYWEKAKFEVTPGGVSNKVQDGKFGIGSGVGWDGTLKMNVDYDQASLSGEIGPDKWKAELSFQVGQEMPDLSQLGTIFKGGIDSLGKVVNAAGQFKGVQDSKALIDAVSPQVTPIKDAAKAIGQVYNAKPNQVSFSFKAGLTGPTTGDQGTPAGQPPTKTGFEVKALLTVTF